VEQVEIKVGPITFAHAEYDAKEDMLYLYVTGPEPSEGDDTPEGHVLFYALGTERIVSLLIWAPRRILEREGKVTVTIPGAAATELTAEELAPALAAVMSV
jgi:hypothetical protein